MTDLDRIKQELTIRDELDRRGIRPVRSDAHKAFYKCPLPGHDDKNASFVCYRDTNSFYCFGCDESGCIIDLVMKLDNVSSNMPFAIWAATSAPSRLERSARPKRRYRSLLRLPFRLILVQRYTPAPGSP